MTAKKSTISLRTLSGLNCIPVGNCIHALATRIHNAERAAPIAVSHVAVKCIPRLTLFQPKNMIATKVASIKNAKIPSMANGAPKISPNARSNTEGKIHAKKVHPIFGNPFPSFVPGTIINRLHTTDDKPQSQRQRDKQPVIHRRQCKLSPRPINKRI